MKLWIICNVKAGWMLIVYIGKLLIIVQTSGKIEELTSNYKRCMWLYANQVLQLVQEYFILHRWGPICFELQFFNRTLWRWNNIGIALILVSSSIRGTFSLPDCSSLSDDGRHDMLIAGTEIFERCRIPEGILYDVVSINGHSSSPSILSWESTWSVVAS